MFNGFLILYISIKPVLYDVFSWVTLFFLFLFIFFFSLYIDFVS